MLLRCFSPVQLLPVCLEGMAPGPGHEFLNDQKVLRRYSQPHRNTLNAQPRPEGPVRTAPEFARVSRQILRVQGDGLRCRNSSWTPAVGSSRLARYRAPTRLRLTQSWRGKWLGSPAGLCRHDAFSCHEQAAWFSLIFFEAFKLTQIAAFLYTPDRSCELCRCSQGSESGKSGCRVRT